MHAHIPTHLQVMLGQDGEDMVTEMLPAQLVSRVEAAKI